MKVFFDVDTQNDFMNIDGKLYVDGAKEIKPNLKKLNDYANKNNILILGTADRHYGTKAWKDSEIELSKWGGPFPNHCMEYTKGQSRIKETENDEATFIPNNFYMHNFFVQEPKEAKNSILIFIKHYKSIIFEKQCYSVFPEIKGGNNYINDFLKLAKIKEAIVYGVATDYCVKAAVLGLQKRKIQCYVVKDAIKGVDSKTTRAAIKEMKLAGAKFAITKDILKGK